MTELITLYINGEERQVEIWPDETLLHVLRERLGLTGTKEGCGEGDCGACTVLVNETSVNSCIYPAIQAAGQRIMTIEGVERDPRLARIQRAFVDHGAVQCGFCTPGLIMSAVEIVGTGKRYNRDELRKLISGHLCRCTGYENILNAMERIVEETYKVVGES